MVESGTLVPMRGKMTDHAITLTHQVRERRRALGLTQEQVADLAGCSPRFIRELEGGKTTVRLDKVLDVAEVLGLEFTLAPRRAP